MPDTGYYTIKNTVNGTIGLTVANGQTDVAPIVSAKDEAIFCVVSVPSKGGYYISVVANSSGFLPQPRETTIKDEKLFAQVATGVDKQLWYLPENQDGSVQITAANGGGSWVLPSNKAGTPVDCRPSINVIKTAEGAAAEIKDIAFWKLTKANIPTPPQPPPGPLDSGKYTIKNVKYGNINISSGSSQVRVVSDPSPATWFIERVDKKGFVYTVSLVQESSPLNGRQAVDAAGRLYISDSNLIVANWVIHPLQSNSTYMIFRDSMTVGPAHWGIDCDQPGTQVGVRFEDHELQPNVVSDFATADECFWQIVKA
ncbi:hypothetical protein JAAARDRAFT_36082 [Jaapia argillacea MUCL 33604]|uniref:Ricin B lectin domain-containing protein n=1 Tax=Jaapia argillacea MUCL 33604 TaxID=933084 RepID=A0A067PP74_9AGAM|nr:hypothetical protein JAAARDRAFT_36082 [Jaapia argillacea MUCL 33604]